MTKTDLDRIEAIQRLAIAEFARKGATGTVEHDPDDPLNTAIHTDDRHTYGLANLTLACLDAPRLRWRSIVRSHVARITAAMAEAAPVDLHDPERRAELRSRLVPADALPAFPEYARGVAPGLVELLWLDQPTTVVTVHDESVAGHDIESLFALGRSQLQFESYDRSAHEATGIVTFSGSSFFTASQVLDPAFVRREIAGAPGIVFLAAERHTLHLARVTGPESVEAIGVLTRFAQQLDLSDAPGGILSRSLYFHDGEAVELVEAAADAEDISLRPGERLLAALQG